MDRVFLDANVLFSAAYKGASPLRRLWALPGTELLTSAYAFEEARRNLVLIRPERLKELYRLAEALTVTPEPAPGRVLPQDIQLSPKDHHILLAAIEAVATHLLTGDNDFEALFGHTMEGVLILLPREYRLTEQR